MSHHMHKPFSLYIRSSPTRNCTSCNDQLGKCLKMNHLHTSISVIESAAWSMTYHNARYVVWNVNGKYIHQRYPLFPYCVKCNFIQSMQHYMMLVPDNWFQCQRKPVATRGHLDLSSIDRERGIMRLLHSWRGIDINEHSQKDCMCTCCTYIYVARHQCICLRYEKHVRSLQQHIYKEYQYRI